MPTHVKDPIKEYNKQRSALISSAETLLFLLRELYPDPTSYDWVREAKALAVQYKVSKLAAMDKVYKHHELSNHEKKIGAVANFRSLKTILIFPVVNSAAIQTVSERLTESLKIDSKSLFVQELRFIMVRFSVLVVIADVALRIRDKFLQGSLKGAYLAIQKDKEFEKIERAVYQTRMDWFVLSNIDWENLPTCTNEEYRELLKKFQYENADELKDFSALNILGYIDKADKAVRGTRLVYDVFCEYLHPNVGDLFSNTKAFRTDKRGGLEPYYTREICVGGDGALHPDEANVFSGIFAVMIEICDAMAKRHREWLELRSSFQNLLVYEVRHKVEQFPNLFYGNEQCFCNSGKLIRECCGENNTNLR